MALSVESAEQQLAQEKAQLAEAQAKLNQALAQYNQAVTNGTIQPGTPEAINLRSQLGISSLQADVETMQTAVADAQQALESAQAEASRPTQSAGQTTTEAQQANSEGADPQSPNTAAQTVSDDGTVATAPANTTGSTAVPPEAGSLTTGTDGRVRSAADVQSSSPSTPNATSADDAAAGGTANGVSTSTSSGAAAAGDDAAGLNAVSSYIAKNYSSALNIVPRDNPLDKFPSYTYNLSVYLMTPDQYRAMLSAQKPSVAGLLLLMSSGGVPNAERNQYFPLDYYMDTLQVKTYVNGKGTSGAHTATELSFRVVEPNGLTFIHNLVRASAATVGNKGTQTAFHNQHYLMVIRFMAMDANGALIDAPSLGSTSANSTTIEKFIPFRISEIRTKVANKLSEYEVSAVCPQNSVATAQKRGTIPYNIELQSGTLENLLSVQLCNALNKFQVDLTKPDPKKNRSEGVFIYPDVYEIKLMEPLNHPSVTTVPPGEINRTATGMGPDPTKAPPNQTLNPATQTTKTTIKPESAIAGTSIVQFIDRAVRTSGYIYQQQLKYYNPKTKKMVDQPGAGKYLAWYRISTEAQPMTDKWDSKRNDYAYKIIYQVAPYLVTDALSDYFPTSPYWPSPKVYYHWFTGQNTQIIDYQQNFNYLYYLVVSNEQAKVSKSQLKNETDKAYQPTSGQTDQGIAGRVNEPGANAADRFYSKGDLTDVRMTIVGDPDWIAQGDVWSGVRPLDPAGTLPDGTINFASREALFDIIFNTPADYDMNQGIIIPAEPGATVTNSPVPQQKTISYRFLATWVTHNFDKGKFTQELNGSVIALNPIKGATQSGSAAGTGGTSVPNNQRATESQTMANSNERTPNTAGEFGYPNTTNEAEWVDQNGLYVSSEDISAGGNTNDNNNGEITELNDYGAGTTSVEPSPSIGPQPPPEPPTSNGQDVGIVSSSDQELTLVSTRRADRLAQAQATATTESPQNMAQEY